ncbi:enoyl-CoA hydratase/isomerase family protein [Hoeflea sp. WL0058]|uniref:3-hydroxyisobutyryl-CoA hydrolase n=1 Tax=Flavimaribacter sediminis TaxID=2865987 RepID=A0AAE2ZP72_9HYPH|nr:enoyl-CoA hydratase/isomerase family protein [Flavimaribacter sediminis]MBW8639686.1 enoyl-CoA hydratase/isomerase family protein [Flavimaribacter sediminis]
MQFDIAGQIEFEISGRAGVVTLVRERALNALNHGMIKAMSAALGEWQSDERVQVVVIKAAGRAFSAGGDLLEVHTRGMAGDPPYGFFADEYRLNAWLGVYPKPIVSLIDGIVMGGGVGISVHGRYRVMTENAVFAMPEVGIGFFPDVGGSHFLPRLEENFGLYLALTGDRVKSGDALKCGIATHSARSDDLDNILRLLSETGDPEKVLSDLCDPAKAAPASHDHKHIRHIFTGDTLTDVISNLRSRTESDPVAAICQEKMSSKCPVSMAVTFRQLAEGRGRSLAECMRMEYRILVRMLQGHDFYEGIRAVIIDKDATPQWDPDSLDKVTKDMVDAYFTSLENGDLEGVPDA